MDWAKLVPELLCSDTARSIAFYRDVLGFKILYERPEEGFAYMDLGGASLMLERQSDYWFTGKLERPYGRGINFEIGVEDVDALCRRVKAADVTLFREIEESQKGFAQRVVRFNLDYNVNPRMAYNHYFGKKPAAKKA